MSSHDATQSPGFHLTIDPAGLEPLIARVVEATIARVESAREQLSGDRLAYSEAEAARLLGLNTHQLRDERLRKRVSASQIVGKRIRYTRDDLSRYLMNHRSGD